MGAKTDRIQGKTKEVTGIVTGDEELEARGTADRTMGETEEKIDEVKDRVKNFLNDAVDKVADVAGMAKDKLPGK
jgi:uncharacterized protein YjbJ (UPF0337 family)